MAEIAGELDLTRRILTVASCRECNAGAGAVFDGSLSDRKARVQAWLRRRHRKLLAIPQWSEEELVLMSVEARRFIQHGLQQKDLLLRRLRW